MSNHHILLVDDETVVRMTTTLILKKLGCEVSAFSNGSEALSFFTDNRDLIDLAIVDSHMPNMSGIELFHELKRVHADLKAVLASGFLDEEDMEQSQTEGFTAVLNKPFRLLELKELIDTL